MLNIRKERNDWESVLEVGFEQRLRASKVEDRKYKDRNVPVQQF